MGGFDRNLLISAVLYATPLVLAAIGELVVERAGVVNIGIEGMMLTGALAGWVVNAFYGRAAGFAGAMLAAVVLALPFALTTLRFAADQIVTGTGINLLALGLTALIYAQSYHAVELHTVRQTPPMLISAATLLLAAIVCVYLRRTRGGLELSAVGEAPQAADTAGVPVQRTKFLAIMFGAACAGLAGAYLSTSRVQGFNDGMTGGIGFLAIALVIFGRWSAPGIVTAGLFFGLLHAMTDAIQARTQHSEAISPLLEMLPYVISLLALAIASGKSGSPACWGGRVRETA